MKSGDNVKSGDRRDVPRFWHIIRTREVELPTIADCFLRATSLLWRQHTRALFLQFRNMLLNCTTDGATLTPTYRKPFDLIFQRAKTEDWSGR